jgi:hypothetical protein
LIASSLLKMTRKSLRFPFSWATEINLQPQPAGGLTQQPILMQPEYDAALAARLNPALQAMSDVSISDSVMFHPIN